MAITPTTLLDIITAARLRTDMRSSQFLTDQEFTSYINASLSQLDMILVSKFNDYKINSIMTNVVANTNYIALPNDFLKFRGLDMQYNTTNPDGYITVGPHNFQKRNSFNYPGSPVTLGPSSVTYRLQGQQIVVLPSQIAPQYNYRLWYTPDFIPLVDPTDTLQPYMDSQMWFDYAVVDVAAKVATMQDQNDTGSVFMQQAELAREHIIKMATPNRDAGSPTFVVDTRDDGDGSGYGWGW